MSGFIHGMEVASSALQLHRARMNVTSSNLANAETTRTADGGPYVRQQVVARAVSVSPSQFGSALNAELDSQVKGVAIDRIEDDPAPARMVYDPGHPDANPDGYVAMPNVNVLEEMVEMIASSRSYEASATAFDTLKSMAQRAPQIGA